MNYVLVDTMTGHEVATCASLIAALRLATRYNDHASTWQGIPDRYRIEASAVTCPIWLACERGQRALG